MENNEQTFAQYFLTETDFQKKLDIMYFLRKRVDIFYDNTVIFKSMITKLFIDYLKKTGSFNLDDNIVISARLLCDCKKVRNSLDPDDIRLYAKKGAEFLANLGFSERFCKICEGVNRYTSDKNREPESDIIELADQFGGMLLDRPERLGFPVDEALDLLQYRNMKDKENRYLPQFIEFVTTMQSIKVPTFGMEGF